MKLLNLIIVNLKRILKNKVLIMLTLLLPVVVTLVVGLLLGKVSDSSRVYYMVNNDKGTYGNQFVEELSKNFNIKLYSREEAMEKLKKKRISQFYEIKGDFSESLKNGKTVELAANRREHLQGYSDFEMKAKDLIGKLIIYSQVETVSNEKVPLSTLNTGNIKVNIVCTKTTSMSGRITINLLITFILFSSIGMCYDLIALKGEGTLRRSLTTANRPGTVIGAVFGAQFIVTATGYILIYLANAVFAVRSLLPQAPVIILNLIMITAVSLSLAIFVSRIIKNERLFGIVLQIILYITCYVGGSFAPIEFLPKSVTLLSRFTPQYWAIESIKSGRYEYSLIVLLFAVLLFTAGTISARSFAEAN